MTTVERPRKPEWLRVRFPGGPNYLRLKELMRSQELHTVCEEARCPNMGECWEAGTATFMILGDVCTRACSFCAVTTGRPKALDYEEPVRVAQAVAAMGLTHAVVTSVNRDDTPDGGAQVFADTIRWIRRLAPGTSVEVLIPDFMGNWDALATVMAARPEILNHNIETVPRLDPRVRHKARYERTLELLERAKLLDPGAITKTGIMLGLGETREEVHELMGDLRMVEVDVLTVGQCEEALALGFRHVESGPLVRSSYHAERQVPAGARGPRGDLPLPLPVFEVRPRE
jgi:lipoic acid synthetase